MEHVVTIVHHRIEHEWSVHALLDVFEHADLTEDAHRELDELLVKLAELGVVRVLMALLLLENVEGLDPGLDQHDNLVKLVLGVVHLQAT